MKKIFIIINSFLIPIFMAHPALGQTPANPTEKGKGAVISPSLTFYYFDQWPRCDKIKVIVNDLKKTQGTKITFKNIVVGAKGSAEEIKKSKLKSHGIIAKNSTGQILKTMDGHDYGKKEIQTIIDILRATGETPLVTTEKEKGAVTSPSLTYYYFDKWPRCDKIKVIVNDLKKTQGTKITFKNISVGAKGSAEAIKKSKLKSHGIVASTKEGKLVTTINGHDYGKKEIQVVIDLLLTKK